MWDEQELLSAAPLSLEAAQVVQIVSGPHAGAWIDNLLHAERAEVCAVLRRALVEGELSGNYTTPDLMSAYQRLGGTESDLDHAVLSEAAARRDEVSPAGLGVVWSRLARGQDSLSEGEVRSWLANDMIRGLASRSVTWTRFSAIVLGDWARKPDATPIENSLAEYLIAKHPAESAAVLAQAMREDPHGAEHLADRLESTSPKTLASLAAAVVDDSSIPAGLRVTLAGRAGETVRARARDMVARELGVSDEVLAKLAPEDLVEPDARAGGQRGATPAAMRLAWICAGIAFLVGSILGAGFALAFVIALVMFVIAWLVGRPSGEGE